MDQPTLQLPIPEDQPQLFMGVDQAGVSYQCELGYFLPNGEWKTIVTSQPAQTPWEPAAETEVEFKVEEPAPRDIPAPVTPAVPLAPTNGGAAHEPIPTPEPPPTPSPTTAPGEPDAGVEAEAFHAEPKTVPEPEVPLAVRTPAPAAPQPGPHPESRPSQPNQAVELRNAEDRWETPTATVTATTPAPSESPGAPSSFAAAPGGPISPRSFWFNVNAELIIYGATEPDATVTLAGRTVVLRPDGTFSQRFAMPDGAFELDAAATSADAVETRTAFLKFSRATAYQVENKA
jgi:hypothetical protein